MKSVKKLPDDNHIKLYSGSLEHYLYLHFTIINPTVDFFIIKLNVNRDK